MCEVGNESVFSGYCNLEQKLCSVLTLLLLVRYLFTWIKHRPVVDGWPSSEFQVHWNSPGSDTNCAICDVQVECCRCDGVDDLVRWLSGDSSTSSWWFLCDLSLVRFTRQSAFCSITLYFWHCFRGMFPAINTACFLRIVAVSVSFKLHLKVCSDTRCHERSLRLSATLLGIWNKAGQNLNWVTMARSHCWCVCRDSFLTHREIYSHTSDD